jgi:hypothetical protein
MLFELGEFAMTVILESGSDEGAKLSNTMKETIKREL